MAASLKSASGVEDSPMAKRGCVPRSRSATANPNRRAMRANSVPPKPEPISARSQSMRVITSHQNETNHRGTESTERRNTERKTEWIDGLEFPPRIVHLQVLLIPWFPLRILYFLFLSVSLPVLSVPLWFVCSFI